MQWKVDVTDALGRHHQVVITVNGQRVSVEPPPPTGGFSMTSDQTDLLAVALLAASARTSSATRRG